VKGSKGGPTIHQNFMIKFEIYQNKNLAIKSACRTVQLLDACCSLTFPWNQFISKEPLATTNIGMNYE
jgi:hypothetical protein